MNTDQQLRDDLTAALDEAARGVPSPDPTLLVQLGGKRLRSRRLVLGAAALAVAVGVGVAGVTLMQSRVTPSPLILATPAPSTASTPVPAAAVRTELTLGDRFDPAGNPNKTFSVTVRNGAGLTYAQVVNGADVALGGSSVEGLAPTQATWGYGTGSLDVLLGLVPRDAVRVGLLRDGEGGGTHQFAIKSVDGTPYAAFALRMLSTPTKPDQMQVMWWRADGTSVTNAGTGQAKTVAGPFGDVELWALPKDGVVGYTDGQRRVDAAPLYAQDPRFTLLENSGWEAKPGRTGTTYRTVMLIQGTATDPALTYTPAPNGSAPVLAVPWPEMGATVIVGYAEFPNTGSQTMGGDARMTSLSWTDASGQRQTWKV